MKAYNYDDTDDENLVEVDEDTNHQPSHRISSSIHNFAEIMSSNGSLNHSDHFSGLYNPRRRKLLTETDQDNIKNVKEINQNRNTFERKTDVARFQKQTNGSENKPIEEFKNNSNVVDEIDEEIYEEASSQFVQTEHGESNFDEATFSPSNKPSTNRDTTGKVKYVEQNDNDIPDLASSEENKSEKYSNIDRKHLNNQQPTGEIHQQNYELKQVINEIDYIYVDQSIQNRRWINKEIMQKRDASRAEDYKRVEAERSLKREFKELEEKRIHNIVHTNK